MRSNSLLLLFISAFIFLSSCSKKDELNPLPTSLITEGSAFSTSSRVLNQVYGLYATFKLTGLYGSEYPVYSDIKAGDFISTNLNPNIGALTYMCQVESGSPEVNQVWRHAYQLINGCNVFLDGMETSGKEVVGDSLGTLYEAEVRGLRAIAYYSLLQLYAQPYTKDNGASPGLPLRLTPNEGLQDYSLARSSVAEVYQQVLDDLDYAESNLPLKYSTASMNTTRLHKNSAIAFKTRVYLAMGKYDKVIAEASKIVSSSAPYSAAGSGGVANALEADIATVFKAPYTSLESIFSVPFSSNDVPGIPLASYYLPVAASATGLGSVGQGQYYLYADGIIADPGWSATDARRSFIFTTPSGGSAGVKWLTKFKVGTPFTDNCPVIRYAEVLLNLSEALLRQNGDASIADARGLLEAVRHRSDPTYVVSAATTADLLSAIIDERHIEFLGEGLRNTDLMRLGLEIPMKAPAGSISVPAVPASADNYIWPLPNEELLYNPGL
ncbi:MAG TPA: RagB/SusD family nutrient uptake outer membrane protein [Verrucomicrobiae bacterium]|nr:RagB/SusD family nutrient uptake outer membrane protein [Verrucomicrobiae bacterium]